MATLKKKEKVGHYSKFFKKFNYEDRRQFPPDDVNLFVGSSTIKHWTTLVEDMLPKKAVNRGFGGSTMAQLLEYHERLILRYKFSRIFIYEGDNDIGRKAEKIPLVLEQLDKLVHIIHNHQPEAGIYILSLKCSPNKEYACETLNLANQKFKEFCETYPFTHFVDFASGFFDENGKLKYEFFKDGMHPSELGYAHMIKVIKPYLYPPDNIE